MYVCVCGFDGGFMCVMEVWCCVCVCVCRFDVSYMCVMEVWCVVSVHYL